MQQHVDKYDYKVKFNVFIGKMVALFLKVDMERAGMRDGGLKGQLIKA
jgi:hypothetical protein